MIGLNIKCGVVVNNRAVAAVERIVSVPVDGAVVIKYAAIQQSRLPAIEGAYRSGIDCQQAGACNGASPPDKGSVDCQISAAAQCAGIKITIDLDAAAQHDRW